MKLEWNKVVVSLRDEYVENGWNGFYQLHSQLFADLENGTSEAVDFELYDFALLFQDIEMFEIYSRHENARYRFYRHFK